MGRVQTYDTPTEVVGITIFQELCVRVFENMPITQDELNQFHHEMESFKVNENYRKRCNFNIEGFINMESRNLGSALNAMFTWDCTNSGDDFWSLIYRILSRY